jgi:hypothetical protein
MDIEPVALSFQKDIEVKQIISKCDRYTYLQNMTILELLIEKNVRIDEGADGCRVNLDNVGKRKLKEIKKIVDNLDKPVENRYQI